MSRRTLLPADITTIAGQVMHDLGIWSREESRMPSIREARKFAVARCAHEGYSGPICLQVASQSLRDYRASHRVDPRNLDVTAGSVYPGLGKGVDCIGVRVIVNITQGPRGGGESRNVSVLVNIAPIYTLQAAVDQAVNAYNNHALSFPKGSPENWHAQDGKIVQLAEGGFGNAQVDYC